MMITTITQDDHRQGWASTSQAKVATVSVTVPSPSVSLSPYQVSLSLGFCLSTMLLSTFLSFQLGTLARHVVLDSVISSSTNSPAVDYAPVHDGLVLPPLLMPKDKVVPHTTYTSKYFDMARSQSSEALLSRKPSTGGSGQPNGSIWMECQDRRCEHALKVDVPGKVTTTNRCHNCSDEHEEGDYEEDEDDDDEEVHEPAGQHLLVDMEGVDGAFLNSQTHLAKSMIELVQSSGLTMLSYHCHKLTPTGVSCAGILLESHVSFHTWPVQGVITLDLFTCGPKSLMPLIPEIERLFGIPADPSNDKPVQAIWSFKPRGYPPNEKHDAGLNDLYNTLLGSLEYTVKNLVALGNSNFQEVAIYDTLEPRLGNYHQYQQAQRVLQGQLPPNDDVDDYIAQHPEFYRADRRMFLDGVVQSRRYGERAYHEALVHPAMLTHPNPKRVAIIGAGEGATLREVLKHNTLEEVVMIEIDELVMQLSRQYLPEWNDCSDLVVPATIGMNVTGNCFDDPRATVYARDAIQWFMDRFLNHDNGPEHQHERFDVIIMDALDPEAAADFSEVLFDNSALMQTMYNALTPQGVFVSQVGEAEDLEDPILLYGRDRHAYMFSQNIVNVGFEALKDYTEKNTRFGGVWGFFLAMKDKTTGLAAWSENDALIELKLRQRAMPTYSGRWPFHHFDSSVMQSYRFPIKVAETRCRTPPIPASCSNGGFDPRRPHVVATDFHALQGETSLWSNSSAWIAQMPISQGVYVGLEACVNEPHVPDSAVSVLEQMSAVRLQAIAPWRTALDQFSRPIRFYGENAVDLDFARDPFSTSKPSDKFSFEGEGFVINPLLERNFRTHKCATNIGQWNVTEGSTVVPSWLFSGDGLANAIMADRRVYTFT